MFFLLPNDKCGIQAKLKKLEAFTLAKGGDKKHDYMKWKNLSK
jgi:hypothetical protein